MRQNLSFEIGFETVLGPTSEQKDASVLLKNNFGMKLLALVRLPLDLMVRGPIPLILFGEFYFFRFIHFQKRELLGIWTKMSPF